MSDLADSFWERVNTLIKSKKTKQQDVAEACGLSYQTFRGWITRSTYPDALQTVKIAKCLGTSVEYLVTGTDSNEYKVQLDQLKQALRNLSE